MIRFNGVSLRRGSKLLFEDASFQIYLGDKLGVVGRNGCGKSSLFNVFVAKHSIDAGELDWPKQWSIAMMAQELAPHTGSALSYVVAGDEERHALITQLAIAESEKDPQKIADLHAKLDDIQAWQAESKAEKLLSGLGFEAAKHQHDVMAFSGGWRVRLNLARALMQRSELLLLDEPTNHLDIDAIAWLEKWLAGYEGTLLLVSHDRDFLNAVTEKTLWFERQSLSLYSGSYEAALRQKNEQLAQQQQLFEKQAAEIAHMEDFVRRFKAKASKAKQAQSRLKALEKMERVQSVQLDSPFTFHIRGNDKVSDPLLNADKLKLGYGGQALLSDVSFSLRSGDRIGVLGHNGAGKSTLLKAISSGSTLLEGELVGGEHLAIGYFAQHQLQALDLDVSPLTQLQRLDPTATEQSLRNFLGGFDFQEEAVADSIHHFSGGEKARLALALIAYQKPNLLVMDEPTNHLDIEVRDALLRALQLFEGAVLLVSHDRYLLRHTVDQYWLVADGKLQSFDGDLEDYQKLYTAAQDADKAPQSDKATDNKKLKRQQAAEKRKQLAPLKKVVQKLEKQLAALEEQSASCELLLADAAIYQDENKEQLKQVLEQKAQLSKDVEHIENEWIAAQEQLDILELEIDA